MKIYRKEVAIVFHDEFVTSKSMADIAEQISKDACCTKLIFNNVKFATGAIARFCDLVDFNCRDNERVMFEFNSSILTERDVDALSGVFQYFTKFHFRNAGLTDRSIQVLANYLVKNPRNITTLHLEDNLFGVDGHLALVNALTKNTFIDKVFLRNSYDFTNGQNFAVVYDNLSCLLEINASIKTIGLQQSHVDYSLITRLAGGLSKNKSLHKIDFGDNAFELDKTGEFTRQIALAIRRQGIINQFDNRLRPGITNGNFAEITSIIAERKRIRNRFFRAVHQCDLVAINLMLDSNAVNIHWTSCDTNYNVLHVLALSNSPLSAVKQVIELLYKHNCKLLLFKRSGRQALSLQPMELALKLGRKDIANALLAIWGNTLLVKNDVPRRQHHGFFAKSLIDTSEFPTLVSAVSRVKLR